MIEKAALLVVEDGALLLCRKRGSDWWILPGGKREAGETWEECLRREIHEELGCGCEVEYLGRVEDEAAEGGRIHLEVYRGRLGGEAQPSGEIEALWWWRPGMERSRLAPSLRERVDGWI